MATNIQMNILQNNGSYEELNPTTNWNSISNKPTIPDVPISVENGGTGQSTASNAIYNLTNVLTSMTTTILNNYSSSVYFTSYYGTTGYKTTASVLASYIKTYLVDNSSWIGIEEKKYTANGTSSYTITFSNTPKFVVIGAGGASNSESMSGLVILASKNTKVAISFLLTANTSTSNMQSIGSYFNGKTLTLQQLYDTNENWLTRAGVKGTYTALSFY